MTKILAVFLCRGFGAVIAYASNLLVTRNLGVSDSGYFFYLVSLIGFLALIMCLGLKNAIVKECSILDSQGNIETRNAVFFKSCKMSLLFAATLAVLSYLFLFVTEKFSSLSPAQELSAYILPTFVLLVFINLSSSFFQSLHKSLVSIATLNVNTHMFFMILLIIAIFFVELNAKIVLCCYLFAHILNACLCMINLKRVGLIVQDAQKVTLPRNWRDFWVIDIAQAFTTQGVMLIAGFVLTAESLGVLGAAQRVSILLGFVLVAVNVVSTPKFSALYANKGVEGLKSYVQKITLFMILLSMPIMFFIVLSAKYIMGFFGEGFSGGYLALIIICLGQFFNVSFGSVGSILNMTGHQKDFRTVLFILVTPTLLAVYYFGEYFSYIGVAVVMALLVFLQNFLLYLFVWKRLGFSTINLNIMSVLSK